MVSKPGYGSGNRGARTYQGSENLSRLFSVLFPCGLASPLTSEMLRLGMKEVEGQVQGKGCI